ncbi:hypothetical protein Tco_0459802 [Tanacetum coccineum]
MVPPNKLGPDLNSKAVNETQYRGMIGSLMYLKGTPSLGLWYPKCSSFDLKGYSESDYARCKMDRKSSLGACQFLGGKLVPIFSNNTSAIAILNNPVLHSRTKNIDIRYHFIKDHILKGDIELHFIPTQYQLADIFTKPLDEPTFKRLIVELVPLHLKSLSKNNLSLLTNPKAPTLSYLQIRLSSPLKRLPLPPTMKAPTQYKEYLCEFWYTAKTLDDSKIWVSTPTGGIRGDIGYSGEIRAKGTLKESFLPLRWRLLMGQIIQCLGGKTGGLDQISNKDATILYCLANEVKVDYAKLIWEDIIHKLNKITREKVIPYPRFISLLLEYMMPKYENEELTINPTQSSLAKDKSPSHHSPPTPVVGEMHKEAHQAASGLTSLGATNKEGAHPQLSSADSTTEVDPGLSAPNDSIPSQQDQTKSAEDGLKTSHTDSDLLKETRFSFFTSNSPQDEPIIVSDESEEEEEVDKDKDTHATSLDKDELEQQKAKAEAEITSLKSRPSYPNINQLTNLLESSLKLDFSKLLASHDFASCLPTKLKELPSKFTELSEEIKKLKKHVKDMEIELPEDLKEIPTFTSTISNLTSQEKIKTLDSLPSLLNKVTDTLNRFATVVENASGATTKGVPSASQATASPTEGEKNTYPATTNAEPNLHDEPVDLMGIDVVT